MALNKYELNDLPKFINVSYPEKNLLIQDYLKGLIKAESFELGLVTLPAPVELVEHFDSTYLDLFDALRNLRDEGFDYSFDDIEKPVKVWKVEGD